MPTGGSPQPRDPIDLYRLDPIPLTADRSLGTGAATAGAAAALGAPLPWPSAVLPASSWLGADAAALAAADPVAPPNDGRMDGAVPTSTPTRPSVVRPTASGRDSRSFGDPMRSIQPRRPPGWSRRASASVSW